MRAFDLLKKEKLTRDDLIYLMKTEDPKEIEEIYQRAYEIK